MRLASDRGDRTRQFLCLLSLCVLIPGTRTPGVAAKPGNGVAITRAASDLCSAKVKRMQEFGEAPPSGKTLTTSITETELNSYLALELGSRYHPSLKRLEVYLEQGKVSGLATLDFDQLGMGARGVLGKAIASLFSGIHHLRVRGPVRATGGKAHFVLEEAHFDETRLPSFLVEEVITAVGRKQRPPFDPMKPSQMPYGIDRVDIQPGLLLVHQ